MLRLIRTQKGFLLPYACAAVRMILDRTHSQLSEGNGPGKSRLTAAIAQARNIAGTRCAVTMYRGGIARAVQIAGR